MGREPLFIEPAEGVEEGTHRVRLVVGMIGMEGLVVLTDALGADGELVGNPGPKENEG